MCSLCTTANIDNTSFSFSLCTTTNIDDTITLRVSRNYRLFKPIRFKVHVRFVFSVGTYSTGEISTNSRLLVKGSLLVVISLCVICMVNQIIN